MEESNDQECGICYSFELDPGELPSVTCSNSKCQKCYHFLCIQDCFENRDTGNCIYCETEIRLNTYVD